MSDDLVKRLRFGSLTTMGSHRMNLEAADRIEELEADLTYWQKDSADAWDKCEDNRVKLAKAVEALKKLRRRQDCLETYDAFVDEIVATTLAELSSVSCANLKGQDDD